MYLSVSAESWTALDLQTYFQGQAQRTEIVSPPPVPPDTRRVHSSYVGKVLHLNARPPATQHVAILLPFLLKNIRKMEGDNLTDEVTET